MALKSDNYVFVLSQFGNLVVAQLSGSVLDCLSYDGHQMVAGFVILGC